MEQPKNMLFCVEKYNARNFMGKNFIKIYTCTGIFYQLFSKNTQSSSYLFQIFFQIQHLRNLFETLDMMFTCANFVP